MKSIINTAALALAFALVPAAGVSAAAQLSSVKTVSALKSKGSSRAPLVAASDFHKAVSLASTTNGYDISGIQSFDGLGDPDNFVGFAFLGASSRVIGIGWDFTLFADSPSWLSEAVISFGSSSTGFVNLTAAIGDDFPGTETYSSGGVIDLVGLGLDFTVDADGQLRVEFFESFDDFPDEWDAEYVSGALFVEFESVIPEPATWAMMIAGFGLVGIAARRRRSLVAQA